MYYWRLSLSSSGVFALSLSHLKYQTLNLENRGFHRMEKKEYLPSARLLLRRLAPFRKMSKYFSLLQEVFQPTLPLLVLLKQEKITKHKSFAK
jgi:hypothetical protein